jgi:CheY-like chemotaxis protein
MSGSDFGFTMRPSRRDLVLVLASSEPSRFALTQRLQEDGYSVVAASSGEEARALLEVARASVLVIGQHTLGSFRSPRDLPCVFLGSPDEARVSAEHVGVRRFASATDANEVADAMPALLGRA